MEKGRGHAGMRLGLYFQLYSRFGSCPLYCSVKFGVFHYCSASMPYSIVDQNIFQCTAVFRCSSCILYDSDIAAEM